VSDYADERPAFRPYMATGIAIVLVATALTAVLDRSWFGDKLDRANLDCLFLLSPPRPSPDIILVEINAEDYHDPELFKGNSPLDRKVVHRLIQDILDAGAKAVGIDLITAEWGAADFKDMPPKGIIWALGGTETAEGSWQLDLSEREENESLGPPALQSVDGEVRKYWRQVPVQDKRGQVPSFTTRLLPYFNSPPSESRDGHGESEVIDFVAQPKQFHTIRAKDVLEGGRSKAWKEKQIMLGKVVLLGGAFPESRDEYQTPLGEMYGVAILANILSAETGTQRFHEASKIEVAIADFLFGVAIVWVSYFVPRPWEAIVVPLGAIVAACVIGLSLFSLWRLYLGFMPILVGVVVHTGCEHFHEYRSALRKLKELEKHLAPS
jgi:CHASE2 domain-containing sensor protein